MTEFGCRDVGTEMVQTLRKAELLLVGGAPRSGTTLVPSLFDGHPEVLVFHPEVHFLLGWLRTGDSARDGLLRPESIFRFPQFPSLVDQEAREIKRKRLREEMGHELRIDTDPSTFRETYGDLRCRLGGDLAGSLRSLAGAYWAASKGASSTCRRPAVLVFKCPYYVDLVGLQGGNAVPGGRWWHVVREPLARYKSAKARRQKNGRVSWVNRRRFVVGHQQVTLSAHALAAKQRSMPGHRVLFHEELTGNLEQSMRALAKDLPIEWDPVLGRPTWFGEPVRKNTSFWHHDPGGAPPRAGAASKGPSMLMNAAELRVFRRLLCVGNVLDRYAPKWDPVSPSTLFRSWMTLHRYERRRDWLRGVWQYLVWVGDPDRARSHLIEELPARLLGGRAAVSGAT